MSGCRYVLAWRGRCCDPVQEREVCSIHANIICASCGQQAVRECSHTGQFVCGAPLCDACEGYEDPSLTAGSWGFGNHRHRPTPTPTPGGLAERGR